MTGPLAKAPAKPYYPIRPEPHNGQRRRRILADTVPVQLATDPAAVRQEIVRTIDHLLGAEAEAVFLFGSRARGGARSDSDWDVMVLTADGVDPASARRSLVAAFAELRAGSGVDVSPVVLRWRDANENAGLLRNVIEEGVPLA